jgi:hypothetical protein
MMPWMSNYSVSRIFKLAAADLFFFIHFVLVVIVAVGWLLPILFYTHLSLLLLTLLSEIFLGYCILTRLEFGIRRKLDPMLSFDKSCMVHYIRKWRGLAPRPPSTLKLSFFKKNSFLFILLALGLLSLANRFWI